MAIAKPARENGEDFYAYLNRVQQYFDTNPPSAEKTYKIKDGDPRSQDPRSQIKKNKISRSQISDIIGGEGSLSFIEEIRDQRSEIDDLATCSKPVQNSRFGVKEALQWGTHRKTIDKAVERMGFDWVIQQITFVGERRNVSNRGGYLASILTRNRY